MKLTGNSWQAIQEMKARLQENLFKAISNIDIQAGGAGGTPMGGGGKGNFGGNRNFGGNSGINALKKNTLNSSFYN